MLRAYRAQSFNWNRKTWDCCPLYMGKNLEKRNWVFVNNSFIPSSFFTIRQVIYNPTFKFELHLCFLFEEQWICSISRNSSWFSSPMFGIRFSEQEMALTTVILVQVVNVLIAWMVSSILVAWMVSSGLIMNSGVCWTDLFVYKNFFNILSYICISPLNSYGYTLEKVKWWTQRA